MARLEDLTMVTAFLAMCVKEKLLLNSHHAHEVWAAHMRLTGIPENRSAELLCKMLGDDG